MDSSGKKEFGSQESEVHRRGVEVAEKGTRLKEKAKKRNA
jgi:hypothetical protein